MPIEYTELTSQTAFNAFVPQTSHLSDVRRFPRCSNFGQTYTGLCLSSYPILPSLSAIIATCGGSILKISFISVFSGTISPVESFMK